MSKFFRRRLHQAMKDAARIADDLEAEEGVALPPGVIGGMGRDLFEIRMWYAMLHDDDLPDEPEDMFR